MAEIGALSLESLATGMYEKNNSIVTFREYIQNSCDAIDDAVAEGILSEGDGLIEISIDKDARRITIEDNGTGISVLDFKSRLSDIGYSDKTLQTDRGFRGIGRLCGLAYCNELRFISTAHGDIMQSTAIFDAAKLRDIFHGKRKYTVKEALDEILSFETSVTDADAHFFRVELIDIVETNSDLLNVAKVRDYLSFVAPVTYSPHFYYQTEIYAHAAALNFTITEYRINVNGEPLDKPYKTKIKRSKNVDDDIFGVDFRDFRDADENLIAWCWIGLSTFKGVISKDKDLEEGKMRGIRLRTGNIQIGDTEVFKHLFVEPSRGTNYFIGEVHTVDKNLIPNSRRDYFEENDACITLEDSLREYFKELYKLYHFASDARSAFNATKRPENFLAGIELHTPEYQDTHLAEHEAELAALESTAAEKKQFIDEQRQEAQDNPVAISSQVFEKIAEQFDASDIEDDNPNTPPRSTAFALVG